MELSNYDLKMFEAAKLEAEKSDYRPFKLGCVITYKGHIIGRGQNSTKTHPYQKKYNRKYRHFNCERGEFVSDMLHAEISAILNVPYTVGRDVDWGKVNVYVYRISHGRRLGFGNARPCPACMAAIRDLGIKHVYYTDNSGYGYLELR
jgi:deoxycytidylate deaminase